LQRGGIEHVMSERQLALHVWQTRRWDNFCLVTPNWQCQLPGHAYSGSDPHGFIRKAEILEYLESFRRGVTITKRPCGTHAPTPSAIGKLMRTPPVAPRRARPRGRRSRRAL